MIRGKHSLKMGVLIIRNRKDQNGRSGYTGNLAFNTNSSRSTGNTFADALLGNFRTYNEADNDPMGFFRFNQTEAYGTDTWKIRHNLSLEIGAHFYHFGPTYTQANNMANFDRVFTILRRQSLSWRTEISTRLKVAIGLMDWCAPGMVFRRAKQDESVPAPRHWRKFLLVRLVVFTNQLTS